MMITLGRWTEASAAGKVPASGKPRNAAERNRFISMGQQWSRMVGQTSGFWVKPDCKFLVHVHQKFALNAPVDTDRRFLTTSGLGWLWVSLAVVLGARGTQAGS